MNAIISNGNYTARVQLPVERRQLAGALSYLHANHASAYDIKYNEDSDEGLTFTLECHGIVENAIAKALGYITGIPNIVERKRGNIKPTPKPYFPVVAKSLICPLLDTTL